MPQRAEIKVVSLGPALKKRPAKATMKRIGIVPPPPLRPTSAHPRLKWRTEFNSRLTAASPTPMSCRTGAPQLPEWTCNSFFWGNSWNAGDATLRQQLVNAALNLIEGPFTSALGQYGLQGPKFRGTTTITSPAPPATFDDGSLGDYKVGMKAVG